MCQPATKLRTLVTLKWEEGRGRAGVGWSLGQVALGRGGTIYEVNYQRKKQSGRPRGGLAIHPGQGAVGKKLKQANLIFSSYSPPTPPRSH